MDTFLDMYVLNFPTANRRPRSCRHHMTEGMMMKIEIGTELVLQKCKHKWINGLDARVVEIRDEDTFVVKSKEGRHIVGRKHMIIDEEAK